ncbi:MAG: hypothetical protein AAB574_01285 [Patescibacteria group bacterium]
MKLFDAVIMGGVLVEVKQTEDMYERASEHEYRPPYRGELEMLGVELRQDGGTVNVLAFPGEFVPRVLVCQNDEVGSRVTGGNLHEGHLGQFTLEPGQHLLIEPSAFKQRKGDRRVVVFPRQP